MNIFNILAFDSILVIMMQEWWRLIRDNDENIVEN